MNQRDRSSEIDETLQTWRLVATGLAEPPDPSFPVNGFPSDAVRDAYLSRIDEWPEQEIRTILRNMLGESRNLPAYDELQLAMLKATKAGLTGGSTERDMPTSDPTGDLAAARPVFTEYERRVILAAAKKTSVPTWEGLTWVID